MKVRRDASTPTVALVASQRSSQVARPRPMQRLHRSADIRAVLAARTSAHAPAMVVHTRRRADIGPARCAVVAGRRLGSAVARNRAKRRLRAALRQVNLPRGLDVVVVVRAAALTLEFPVLTAQLSGLVERAVARTEVGA